MRRRLAVLLLTLGAVAPAAAAATLPGIVSPSGNIRCTYLPPAKDDTGHLLAAVLLCDIRQSSYAAELQDRCLNPNGQKGAGVDWHGFGLGPRTRGSLVCSGGLLVTKPAKYATLAYGKSWRRGVFTCASRITGITCTNPAGHGLFVSRRSWRVW
jgi:hypothetical protein